MSQTYQEVYSQFLEEHSANPKTADEISDFLLIIIQHFVEISSELAAAETVYFAKLADILNSEDPQTGKPMAVTKGEVLGKATAQYGIVNVLKKNLVCIENIANSLKLKARAAAGEYMHQASS